MKSTRTARRSKRRARLRPAAVAGTLVAGVSTVVVAVQPAEAAPPTPSFGPGIDGYQPYDGQDTCDDAPKPGVVDFRNMVLAAYPGTRDSGISRACGSGGRSEHKEGRAWDWGVSATTERHLADDLLNWLLAPDQHGNRHALARRFGIMYIIWDRQVWKSYDNPDIWHPYPCSGVTDCHQDHVHISFSWAGALRGTTWWTAQQAPRPIGKDTVGYFHRGSAGGEWHLTNDNAGASDAAFVWGPNQSNVVPLVGDWNGDGKDTIGFYRSTSRGGEWHLTNDNNGQSDAAFVWGPADVVPVVGDWNADGKDTIGYYVPSRGEWHLNDDNEGQSEQAFQWGPTSGVTPITGDWNADGKDTVGFYGRSTGAWHLTNDNEGPSDASFEWGPGGNVTPITGDWNGL